MDLGHRERIVLDLCCDAALLILLFPLLQMLPLREEKERGGEQGKWSFGERGGGKGRERAGRTLRNGILSISRSKGGEGVEWRQHPSSHHHD